MQPQDEVEGLHNCLTNREVLYTKLVRVISLCFATKDAFQNTGFSRLNRVTIGPGPQGVFLRPRSLERWDSASSPSNAIATQARKTVWSPVNVHGNRYITLTGCHGYLAAGSHNTFSLIHFS